MKIYNQAKSPLDLIPLGNYDLDDRESSQMGKMYATGAIRGRVTAG